MTIFHKFFLNFTTLCCLAIYIGTCSAQSVPRPYHEPHFVVVEKVENQNERLSSLTLRSLQDPQASDRRFTLQGRHLFQARRFAPFKVGDAFVLQYSILNDAEGNFVEESYSLQRRVDRSGLKLTHQGFSDLEFGTTANQLADKLHYHGVENSDCRYAALSGRPEVLVMVNDGIVARIDFLDLWLAVQHTPFVELAANPSDLAAWLKRHPDIEASEHEYQQGWYLGWFNAARNRAIVAEFVDNQIIAVRGGQVPEALYVEGCS